MSSSDILQDFIIEAMDNLQQAETALLKLEAGGTNKETIASLFRSLHTIKGNAGFLQLDPIKKIAHAMENIAGGLRDQTLTASKPVFDTLLRSADVLKKHIINLSLPLDPAVIDELEQFTKKDIREKSDVVTFETLFDLAHFDLTEVKQKRLHLFAFQLDPQKDSELKDKITHLIDELEKFGTLLAVDPPIESWGNSEARSPVNFLFASVIEDPDIVRAGIESEPVKFSHKKPQELDTIKNQSPPSATVHVNQELTPSQVPADTTSSDMTVRISVKLLDNLMNLASELLLVRNRNIQAVARKDISLIQSVNNQLNQVTSDIQSTVLQTRMKPVNSIFNRYTRVVRDLSAQLEKHATLIISENNVELDKSIIDSIADPLTHLIRNAIDHGIELPAERLATGKCEYGTVRLSAFYQAGQVAIQISDDGKGMDPEKLKKTAIRKGLLTEDQATALSTREALNLIFVAGFSTVETVTEISGRGVGMDVVQSTFKKLGGIIDIESIPGKGSTITVKLPLTLAIIQTLIVSIENCLFAIPQNNIAEVVWLHGDDCYQKIKTIDSREVHILRGSMLPLIRFAEVLKIDKTYVDPETGMKKPDRRKQRADRRQSSNPTPEQLEKRTGLVDRRKSISNSIYIIVIRYGTYKFGLVLDSILTTEEIVIKPLHNQLSHTSVFSGTTILGDGKIALILDVTALTIIAKFDKIENDIVAKQRNVHTVNQRVLLFSLGSDELFALPLFLISRVEEIHASGIHPVGGKEYITRSGTGLRMIRIEDALPGFKSHYSQSIFLIIPKSIRPFGFAAAQIIDTIECDFDINTTAIRSECIAGSRVMNEKPVLFPDIHKIMLAIEPDWFAGEFINNQSVLIIDDNFFYASVATSFFLNNGYMSMCASSESETSQMIETSNFTFIIIDIEILLSGNGKLSKTISDSRRTKKELVIAVAEIVDSEIESLATERGYTPIRYKYDLSGLLDIMRIT